MTNLFARAATLLLCENTEEAAGSDGRLLLEALGYATAAESSDGGESTAETHNRVGLLNAASRFARVFELAAPDAPGLVSFGAEFDPALADPMHAGSPRVGVSGVGLSLQEAFQGCIGEGIEYLSQLQTGNDVLERICPGDRAATLGPQGRDFLAAFSAHRLNPNADLSWHRATRLIDGREVLLPADLCLRRPSAQQEIKPLFPLSTGSAAGKSWQAAALHGLLELIERDAASLWWQGGQRGGSIPPQDEAHVIAAEMLPRLRQDASRRRNWLLDITTDIGIPCVASLSCTADGFGLAFGLAARPTLASAARSAILEMCQIELAHAVVEAKCRERGENALNQRDRAHRRRATMINADHCVLLQPAGERPKHPGFGTTDPGTVLNRIMERLAKFGIETFGLDLTRPGLDVPVARVIAPGLQLEPSELTTPRLAEMIARTGGGGKVYRRRRAGIVDASSTRSGIFRMRQAAEIQGVDERGTGTAARLSISLIGRLTVRFKGRLVELRTQKAGAVLSYLALAETKHESRERLVGLLWSRSDEEKARASLRQVVRELRSVFEEAGYDGFSAGRLSVHLDAETVEVDVESIVGQAESGSVHPLLLNTPHLGERILEGMDDLDPSFRVWVLAKRQTVLDRLMRNLGAGLVSNDVAADTKREVAAAIVNLDPTHEEACCHLMRVHAEQGDVAGALRIYKALWNLLDRDYGMEPSPVTEELVADIKLGAFERPATRFGAQLESGGAVRTSNAPPDRLIVPEARLSGALAKIRLVLRPFEMHGVDSDHAHLAQGFSLHLAACLVRFREWSVIDRPPAAVPLPPPGSAPQYCIETTAYQAGDEINMVMVLRDEATGIYVWSESLRLGLDNWFETQQRIIRRIATSLNVQLSAERLMRLAGEPDVSLDVHDRWLRGQSLLSKFDAESWQRAVTIFRDAIRENPTFSPCYSSLVQMNNIEHIVHPGVFRDLGKAKGTLELAKTAVQLDPVDSRAHLCCGWSYVTALRETEAAPHMQLACELNDNDPWTLLSSAHYCAFCGSIGQARLRAEQSLALSPAPSYLEWGYHGIIRVLCGDYAGALDAIDHAQDVIKTLPAWRAAALFHLGEEVKASEQARRFLNGIRSFWVGSEAPSDEAITRWLLQAHPISIRSRWEVLRHGLRGAGLPVEGIAHLS